MKFHYLESSNSIHHPLELYSLDILILAVHPLNSEDVVTKVKTFKSSLLRQKDDHDTSGPVQAFPKQLLNCKLIFTN